MARSPSRHIVFFHPDLGIGGAERLVVDAAVGLQKRGHRVTIFTSHCDPKHCFEEARDGKMLPCRKLHGTGPWQEDGLLLDVVHLLVSPSSFLRDGRTSMEFFVGSLTAPP